MRLWNAEKGQQILTLKGHTGGVLSVCFSPDGKRLASASSDKTVRVWDAEKGQEVLTLQGYTDIVWSVCFSRLTARPRFRTHYLAPFGCPSRGPRQY